MRTAREEIVSMIYQLPEQQLEKIVNYILLLKNSTDAQTGIEKRGDAIISLIKGRAASGMSTDEIMRLTRGE